VLHSGSNFGKISIPFGIVTVLILISSFFVEPFSSTKPSPVFVMINHVNQYLLDSRNLPNRFDVRTYYTFQGNHYIIENSLRNYQSITDTKFNLECKSNVCEIDKIAPPLANQINIFKTPNKIVEIEGRRMIQFYLEIVPDYPTRYSFVESKGNTLTFENDPNPEAIVNQKGEFHKNGIEVRKWVVGILVPQSQQRIEIIYVSTYCEMNYSPFLKKFFELNPKITIEGYGMCKLLTLHNSIIVNI
jgi:hypothetical protein